MPQELSLEVGNEAWHIIPPEGWGVITPTLADFTSVRVFGVQDCREYASFDAAPGGFYIIRFAEDASTTIEQVTGSEDGPSLGERDPTGCG